MILALESCESIILYFVFMGSLLGNWESLPQSFLPDTSWNWSPLPVIAEEWGRLEHVIHEAGSTAKCLRVAPRRPWLVSVIPTLHLTNSPVWLHLQPDNHSNHYYSWLFPDTLGSGPVYILTVFLEWLFPLHLHPSIHHPWEISDSIHCSPQFSPASWS